MTAKTEPTEFSRRKMFTRIGGLAVLAYSVPAVTMLSAAHAGSGASAASKASEPSKASAASDPSKASEPSAASTPSVASGPSGTDDGDTTALDECGPEDLTSDTYQQCLTDHGFEIPT